MRKITKNQSTTLRSVGYVDEKAQLYYINKNIPTFAFELQFLKMGRAIEGWFLNDNLKTDYYLLIWPCASIDDVKRLKKEDFTKLDALMVSKGKLRDKLSSLGLDKELKEIGLLKDYNEYYQTGMCKLYCYFYEVEKQLIEYCKDMNISKIVMV